MGFDVVYLPPIHPIGEVNRKGRNNSVVAEPGDVGSPWAIGSAAGRARCGAPGAGHASPTSTPSWRRPGDRDLEVALDLALQCAPDHPWVTEHPEWFTTLPDGTIAYAENPPKRYQDIYPLNFDNDPDGLYAEILRVVRFWIDRGVTIFRVDNPHTKPINFWAWLIATVHDEHPEVIFLAEAFTIPAMMAELARLGFSQSYTYFIWRTRKAELIDYGTELLGRVGLLPAELLRQHPGHPARIAADRRAGHVRDPGHPGGHHGAQLGRLLRLRAVRGPAAGPGQRGVPGLGEVPAAAAGLRRRAGPGHVAAAADHHAEPTSAAGTRPCSG